MIPNVRESELGVLSIYPNPSQGQFNLELAVQGELNVINALGETVAKFSLPQGLQTIQLEDLAKGVYLLQFNRVNAGRIILE